MKNMLIALMVMGGCVENQTEVESPPTAAGCTYLDAGHQADMSVQGHELPAADVLAQVCWQTNGQLATFEGESLELPIGESWSYTIFFREVVYTPASLRGVIEQTDDTYNIVGCEIELTLDAARSKWIECTISFNPAEGTATLGFAETILDAEASELSAN